MTKFPTESRNVKGVEVDESHPAHKVGPTCATPGCTRLTDHAHHLFSRGLMGGDFKWVRLEDGTELFNLAPLCYRHHEQVTNNEVAIKWDGERFTWNDEAPLTWQPEVIYPEEKKEIQRIPYDEALALGVETPYKSCPTCKRRWKGDYAYSKNHPEKPRPRRTWAVAVPEDRAESGFDVLEELLNSARDKMEDHGLDWGEGKKNKYFILSTALALFVSHADQVLSDS